MRSLSVAEGSDVVIIMGKNSYIVTVCKDKKFHTHRGYIELSGLIGKPYGSVAKTSTNQKFLVMRPSTRDYTARLSRATQVIYPKDAAAILMWSNVKPGQRVLESGTGSGALTACLAEIVGTEGRVYGFDLKQSSLEKTEENLKRRKLLTQVELQQADVSKGVALSDLDAVVLDLPSPWAAVKTLKASLKKDGFFVSFSPTMNQVEKTVVALKESGFVVVEAFELIQRFLDAKPNATRPNTVGVYHTGYIVAARNTELEHSFEPPKPARNPEDDSVNAYAFFESFNQS